MHGWKRNPKAPNSLWDGLVFDGACAGLHPGTNRFVDGSGLENHGTLTNMDAATDWVWSDELGQWVLDFDQADDYVVGSSSITNYPFTLSATINPVGTGFCAIIGLVNPAAVNVFYGLFLNDLSLAAQARNTTAINSLVVAMSAGTHHVGAVFASPTERYTVVDGVAGTLSTTSVSWNAAATTTLIGVLRLVSPTWYYGGQISNSLVHSRVLSLPEFTWLADRSNRMYVPDTRRHFWFPMSRPWLYSEVNHHIGMGLGV